MKTATKQSSKKMSLDVVLTLLKEKKAGQARKLVEKELAALSDDAPRNNRAAMLDLLLRWPQK